MVIPIGGGGLPQLRGPVPPECSQLVVPIKWSVIGMIICFIGRMMGAMVDRHMTNDMLQLLNLFMVIVMGTFVLHEDQHLKQFYSCLATSLCSSCHEQGMGGLGCLMPFVMISILNLVFDLLLNLPRTNLMPFGIFVCGSILCEGVAGLYGYRMVQMVRSMGLGMSPAMMEMGGGGSLNAMQGGFLDSGSRGGYAQPREEAAAPSPQSGGGGGQDGGGGAGPGGGAGGFQPFAGSGQRLGS